MLIAQAKRKENIIEYLIYMFQIEDMVRACKLDISIIEEQIISQYNESYEIKRDIREWYNAMISMLKDNKLEEKGHIPLIETLLSDLNETHLLLLSNSKKPEYRSLYSEIHSAIEELKLKSGEPDISDIKASLNGIYGFLILKMSSKKVNKETENAINQISSLLTILGQEFHLMEKGEKNSN